MFPDLHTDTFDVFRQVLPAVDEASPDLTSSFEMLDTEHVPPPYQIVQPHWFYYKRGDDNALWLPFSREDSDKLENADNARKHAQTVP